MTLLATLAAAIDPLPTEDGGIAVTFSTSGPPPAVALLSSGSIAIQGDRLQVAVIHGSSVATRLGGMGTLLVPYQRGALRAQIADASVRPAGAMDLIEGTIGQVLPSMELPWSLRMHFAAAHPQRAQQFVTHWQAVRHWLDTGAVGDAPVPPKTNIGPDQSGV